MLPSERVRVGVSDWTTSEADRALRAYLRAVISAEPIQTALMEKYGVRLADFRALRILRDNGPMPISRFAAAFAIVRSTATGVVDRLEERGLIERTFGKSDRRTIDVRITPRGLTALEDSTLFRESDIGQRIAVLPESEQRQLADLLERLDGEAASVAPEPVTLRSER